ncbi:MAG: hypothetical protein WC477_03670 [Patescibacteria group bacterium]
MQKKKILSVDDLYLSKDKDILDQLADIHAAIDHEFDDGWFDKQQSKLQILQIKASLRNRKTMEESATTAERYSTALMIFATIQILVMLFQLILSAQESKNQWGGFIIVIECIVFVVIAFRIIDKYLEKK